MFGLATYFQREDEGENEGSAEWMVQLVVIIGITGAIVGNALATRAAAQSMVPRTDSPGTSDISKIDDETADSLKVLAWAGSMGVQLSGQPEGSSCSGNAANRTGNQDPEAAHSKNRPTTTWKSGRTSGNVSS